LPNTRARVATGASRAAVAGAGRGGTNVVINAATDLGRAFRAELNIDNDEGNQAIAHGVQLTKVGKEFMHDKVVKEEVFARQKFATLDGDLLFSNNPNSICRYMANRLKVQEAEVETWWETQRRSVHAQLKKVRNNAIKNLKTLFTGKAVSSWFILS
jgi:hypothetical protein